MRNFFLVLPTVRIQWLATLALSAWLGACSSGSSASGGNQGAATAAGSGTPAASGGPAAAASNPASAWCAAAEKTQIVQTQGISPLFSLLCVNGAATQFLSTSLVNAAYGGSGTPSLEMVQPISDTNGTLTGVFGFGVKMGITAATAFTQVAPTEGQVAIQTQKVAAEGGTPGQVTVQAVASKADTGWTRGWVIDAPSSTSAGFLTLKTEYVYELDQYQLGTGLYMETSTLQRSVTTVKDYEVLTAIFDINGRGYQLTIAQVSASDEGEASQASSALSSIVTNLVKFMYSQTKGG